MQFGFTFGNNLNSDGFFIIEPESSSLVQNYRYLIEDTTDPWPEILCRASPGALWCSGLLWTLGRSSMNRGIWSSDLHVVILGNVSKVISNDRKCNFARCYLAPAYIIYLLFIVFKFTHWQTDQSNAAKGKLILFLGEGCDFCGADRRLVAWVGEQYSSFSSDVIVEIEGISRYALSINLMWGYFGIEVWGLWTLISQPMLVFTQKYFAEIWRTIQRLRWSVSFRISWSRFRSRQTEWVLMRDSRIKAERKNLALTVSF
jgi:hypothetical protein